MISTSPLPPIPTPRGGACGHVVDSVLYAIGGGLGGKHPVATVEACDLTTGTWSARAPMPTPRNNVASAVLDGRIVVVGGLTGQIGEEGIPSAVVEAYDPRRDAWEVMPPMPIPRVRAGVVAHGGRIIVVGGRRDELDTDSIAAFDPRRGSWSELGVAPYAARHLAAAVLDGRILVSGGFTATPGGAQKGIFRDALFAIDPVGGTCSALAPMPQERTAHVLVACGGRLHAIGGVDREKRFITAVDSWDPVAGAWTRGQDIASGRAMLVAGVHEGAVHLVAGWSRLFKEANPASDVLAP